MTLPRPIKLLLSGFMLLLCFRQLSARPGGEPAFSGRMDAAAFSQPVAGMHKDAGLDFTLGRALFRRVWVTAPASTQTADGLGPLYNARSCAACHPNNGRGHPPGDDGDDAMSLLLRIDIPPQDENQRQALARHHINNVPEPTYGLQLQGFAIPGHRAEYRLAVSYEEIPLTLGDGSRVSLRKPDYTATVLGYGPLHPQARLSPRVAPQLIGLGLLEAVGEGEILAWEDPDDRNGDGISGRANRVWSPAERKVALGRFGHKAGAANVDEQLQAAFFIDLGLSVPLYPQGAGDCSIHQLRCRAAPDGNSTQYQNLEAHKQVTDLVGFYVTHLAVPARRNAHAGDVLAGARIFRRLGCDSCHRAQFRTVSRSGTAAGYDREISPYTDLLLHDMGEGLADHRPEGLANGREWRTAPLWGVGLTPQVSGHSYFMHDGRARSLLEAILWHGGEAQAQRDAVASLERSEREQLLAFVESL